MNAANAQGKVYIVLVNWRNPFDTLECVQSLLNQEYSDFQVVVCDNGSGDGSMEVFRQWADGRLCPALIPGTPGEKLAQWRVDSLRGISFVGAAKANGLYEVPDASRYHSSKVLFVDIPENLGFAGGNNVGLRYGLTDRQATHFWVLNNDTVVAKDSIYHLLRKQMDGGYGMVGASIYHYHEPDCIQYSCGAVANKVFATVVPLAEDPLRAVVSKGEFERNVERRISYVVGASILVPRNFLTHVGLMSEDYFLYYEEQDWAARSALSFKSGYASEALVFHKEGASIGGKTKFLARKSLISDFYATRSRVLFTKKHASHFLPFVLAMVCISFVIRLARGLDENAKAVGRGVFHALRS